MPAPAPSPQQRFEALFRAHHAAVLRYALRRTDPATAEDVAGEVFATCWRRLDRVPQDHPLPWLLTTARHELLSRHRATGRAGEKARRFAAGEPLASPGPDAGVTERDAFAGAWAALPEADREALRLVAWDGLSSRDAARVAGTTRAAFAMRVSRARRRLRAALAEHDDPAPATAPRLETP